jgi:HD-like signal output (HDOD) protein
MMDIWGNIRRMIAPRRKADSPPARRRRTDVRLTSAGPEISLGAQELEREFLGLLLGAHSFVDIDLNNLERKVLKAMEALSASDLSSTNLVPHLLAIVRDLFSYLNNDANYAQELTRRIKQDQILLKDVIRAANTPYYRSQGAVKNLEQAVAGMGHDRLRQLVALISIKPIFNMRSGHFGPLAAPRLWAQSERCAIACDCLAKQMRVDVFTAFMAGLTSSTGLYLGARILDKVSDGTQSPHSIIFRQNFVRLGRILSVKVARRWNLSEAVINILSQQVETDDVENLDVPGSVLYAGEKLSQLRVLAETGRLRGEFSSFTCRLSGTLMDSCSLCYKELEKFAG